MNFTAEEAFFGSCSRCPGEGDEGKLQQQINQWVQGVYWYPPYSKLQVADQVERCQNQRSPMHRTEHIFDDLVFVERLKTVPWI
jgi:hypothetical protein